jgi:hypothetical protein
MSSIVAVEQHIMYLANIATCQCYSSESILSKVIHLITRRVVIMDLRETMCMNSVHIDFESVDVPSFF